MIETFTRVVVRREPASRRCRQIGMNNLFRWWRRIVVITIVAMAVTIAGPATPASACSCVPFEDVLQMNLPAAAFIGEVIDEGGVVADGFGGAQVALLYEVETVYHGDVPSQVVVRTSADTGGGCGLSFRGRTAVLAYIEDGEALSTSICSAVPLDQNDQGTQALLEQAFGPGTSPTPVEGVGLGSTDRGLPVGLLVGAGVFALALAGSSVLLFRRQG